MKLRLMPREEQFFGLFNDAAGYVVEAAEVLQELVNDLPGAAAKAARAVDIEHKCDSILHEVLTRLNNTFITPLDREDIHTLIAGLDDIVDFTEATCDRLTLYGVEKVTEESVELADVLVRAAKQVQEAVSHLNDLRHIRKVLDPCVRVNDFENEGDRINRRALQRVFGGEMQPLDALKWREIYDHFEAAIDRCEYVAHLLESIVVKNA